MEACMTFVRDIVENAFDKKNNDDNASDEFDVLNDNDIDVLDDDKFDVLNDDKSLNKCKHNDGSIRLTFDTSNPDFLRCRYQSEYFNYKKSNDNKDSKNADHHIREYFDTFAEPNNPDAFQEILRDNQCISIDQLIERIESGTKTKIWKRTFFVNNTGHLMCRIDGNIFSNIHYSTADAFINETGFLEDLNLIYQTY
jgi:hypothetical protein